MWGEFTVFNLLPSPVLRAFKLLQNEYQERGDISIQSLTFGIEFFNYKIGLLESHVLLRYDVKGRKLH